MADTHTTERVNTVVIGGGQAGLSGGYDADQLSDIKTAPVRFVNS